MSIGDQFSFHAAIQDFRDARRKAILRAVLARLTGKSTSLYSFEEVRQMLKAQVRSKTTLKEIPLDSIIGSVNRYEDFMQGFLPRANVEEQRWARVDQVSAVGQGVPPIEVYQIDQTYFVIDGNHRVSVARQIGQKTIQAYVTEVSTPVPLTPDIDPQTLILKAEYADFLEQTRLNEARHGSDLSLTVPGQYEALKEHISVHRYFLGIEQQREIPYREAAAHFYDTVYLPVVETIREHNLLRDFPNRTEADLYLWLAEHSTVLEEELGKDISPSQAARNLAEQFSSRLDRVAARVLESVLPDQLERGPDVGTWRREKSESNREDDLFCDILVPINGLADGWFALQQALVVGNREGSNLFGLHVTQSETDQSTVEAQAVLDEFNRRCQAAGVKGSLTFAVGDITRVITERTRWNDLAIFNLTYPPSTNPLVRFSSGFRTILMRTHVPVLIVPQRDTRLNHGLLAYDGSSKADEALYVTAYLARKWQIGCTVISVAGDGEVSKHTQERARAYLESLEVTADYILGKPPVVKAIFEAATEHACDFILMGGYGRSPFVEAVLSSTVNSMLQEMELPVLICR